jgi:hypothetical protein
MLQHLCFAPHFGAILLSAVATKKHQKSSAQKLLRFGAKNGRHELFPNVIILNVEIPKSQNHENPEILGPFLELSGATRGGS